VFLPSQDPETRNPFSNIKRNAFLVMFGLIVIVSILFTLAGPFGTFQVGHTTERFIYWFVLNGVSFTMALGSKYLIIKCLDPKSVVAIECLTILATTLLFTPFLWCWTVTMFPDLITTSPNILWMGGVVLIICSSISILFHGASFVMGTSISISPVVSEGVGARLLRRLPTNFDGKIIHLSADGHIVRAFTDTGVFELRMRFSDAVEEVSELDGVCIHRSHWVVLAEIVNVGAVNGRPCLLLSNGEELPVSRKHQTNLEARGIL
jgi:hypothetical protein